MTMKPRFILIVWIVVILVTACATPQTVIPATPTDAPILTATVSVTPSPLDCSKPIGTRIKTQGTFNVYTDPANRFTIPIPTNWKAESTTDYVRMCDPLGTLKAFALVVPATIAAQGVGKAWAQLVPDFDLPMRQSLKLSPPDGVDEMSFVTYDGGAERQTQATGQRINGNVYVLLIDGSKSAFDRRQSQINILQTGMNIAELPKTDLSKTTPKTLTPEMLSEFENYIVASMRDAQVPGAQVAVVQNGKIVLLKGFGVREMDKNEPVTPDTLMMTGSTGKSLTTLMMATLVDEGKMQWDTPAVRILPSFAVSNPQLSQKITMRNLVCACTGVPRHDVEAMFNASRFTAADIIQSLKSFELYTDFGEAFQYSNEMVAAGGYIAAAAGSNRTDRLYDDYVAQMQKRVFDPIGMPSTTYSFDKALAANHAMPHAPNLFYEYSTLSLDIERILIPIAPAGAGWSNARDMSRYLLTLMNLGVNPDGKRVVSVENLQMLWQPQVAVTAQSSYGLGWFVDTYKGMRMIHHGGNTFGFTTDLAFLPDSGLGIFVITNLRSSNTFNEAIRFRLFEIAYGLPMEYDRTLSDVLKSHRQQVYQWLVDLQPTVNRQAVEPYLGTYTNDMLGEVRLSLDNGKLILTAPTFAMELRGKADKNGQVSYWGFTVPLRGDEFKFEQDNPPNGKRRIVLIGPDSYTFLQK